MGRVVPFALLLACSGPASIETDPGPKKTDRSSISIYRDGDKRFALDAETIYRPDGNTPTLGAVKVAPPVALVVETARLNLREGSQRIALPRVPSQAAASSIWLEPLSSPPAFALKLIEPGAVGSDGLLGRRVKASVGETEINGVAVASDFAFFTVRADDGRLWLVNKRQLELAAEGPGFQSPIASLDVRESGEHLVEIGYTTSAIDWSCDYRVELGPLPGPGEERRIEADTLITVKNNTEARFESTSIVAYSGTLSSARRHPVPFWRGSVRLGAHDSVSVPTTRSNLRASVGFEYRPIFRVETGDRSKPLWGQSVTTEVTEVLWLRPADGEVLAAGKIKVISGDTMFESVLRERVLAPKTASVRLRRSANLRGRRMQRATRVSPDGQTFTESIEIEVQNRGSKKRSARVVDRLLRSSRFELKKSEPKAELDGEELVVTLEIEPGDKKSLRYTVQYEI